MSHLCRYHASHGPMAPENRMIPPQTEFSVGTGLLAGIPEATGASPDPINESTDLFGLAATLTALLLCKKRGHILAGDADLLAQRHNLDLDKAEVLTGLLADGTQAEQQRRGLKTAAEFKVALRSAAQAIDANLNDYDWKGIADGLSKKG